MKLFTSQSLAFVLMAMVATAWATPRPNIILLMADDMGWGDPGYNSRTVTFADGTPHPDQGWISTPTLDAMAADGLRFDRFYSAGSVCSPTRASCLTGRHPHRVGVPNANAGRLGFDETPLSEVLSTEGYLCGHFGKWHLGTMTTLRDDSNRGPSANVYSAPWHHSYDVCFATESKVPTYHPYRKEVNGSPLPVDFSDSNFYGTHYWRIPATWSETSGEGDPVLPNEVNNTENGDDSKLLADQAIPFIQDAVSQGKPFFAVVWFHTPHKPVVDPEGLSAVNSSDSCKDSIEDFDFAVGRIRDELDTLGVRNNTMFWVTSDNGPENGVDSFNESDTGRSIRSGRYRARKRSLYEGGVRVPGILEWPDMIPLGMVSDFPAVTSDYYPTILDYLQLSVPNQKPLDGISLRPVIDGTATTRTKPIGFKYGKQSWVNHQYKLIKDGTWALYDLINIAPGEEVEQTAIATESNIGSQPQAIQDIYNTMLAEHTVWEATLSSDTPYVHASQPTVVLSTPSGSVSTPFTVTATFSEAVTQLNANEFVVDNGTASDLAGSGTIWTVTISPSSSGTVGINLPEGCVIDPDGNINADSNLLEISYSNPSAPDVTLATPINLVSAEFVVTATFTEAITGLELSDFDVGNGFVTNLLGGPSVYTVTVSPASVGTVSVFLPGWTTQNGDSNGNNASNPLDVTYELPAPPTAALSGPVSVAAPYTVTVTFSEPVTGLTEGDFTVGNGTASGVSGSEASYTVLITPVIVGNVTVMLPADSVVDLNDGLGNTASGTLTTSYAEFLEIIISTTLPLMEGQTVDSEGNVPGDKENNIAKFSGTSLYARSNADIPLKRVRAFVKFDLASLTNQPVSSAQLTFTGFNLNSTNPGDVEIFPLAADWSASGSPSPTYNHSVVAGAPILTPLQNGTYGYSINIASVVQNWTSGVWENHGLRVDVTSVNNGLGIMTTGEEAIQLLVEERPLKILDLRVDSGEVSIIWNSAPSLTYQVQSTQNLTNGWSFLKEVPSAGGITTNIFTIEQEQKQSFYRVILP